MIFQPFQVEGKIALKIYLQTYNRRPERLLGKPFEEVISDEGILEVLKPLNETVNKFSEFGLIEGTTFNWDKKYMFDNLIDEFKLRKDELWEAFSGNVEYWINLKSPSDFEDKRIIETIGELILAAYELNNNAKDLS